MKQSRSQNTSRGRQDRLAEEVEFWRNFVRRSRLRGDQEMVRAGEMALENVLKRLENGLQ